MEGLDWGILIKLLMKSLASEIFLDFIGGPLYTKPTKYQHFI